MSNLFIHINRIVRSNDLTRYTIEIRSFQFRYCPVLAFNANAFVVVEPFEPKFDILLSYNDFL